MVFGEEDHPNGGQCYRKTDNQGHINVVYVVLTMAEVPGKYLKYSQQGDDMELTETIGAT